MKKIFFIVFAILFMFSCKNENNNIMYVKGKIKGLKKGTLYLQKQIDSVVVSVDSIKVNGTDEFLLTDKIESPEMYYLTLGKSDKKIPFFGEKDTISITSGLERFGYRNKITGSVNQDLLDKYYEYIKKFNDQDLMLIKAEFEAKRSANQDSILLITKQKNNLLKRKYLYSINYAMNNVDHEVAPFIALTDLNYAQTKWLDSIYNSLTPKIKESKYGKQLDVFIKKIKNN